MKREREKKCIQRGNRKGAGGNGQGRLQGLKPTTNENQHLYYIIVILPKMKGNWG